VQYLECNVPEGLEEITYEVKIIGNEGSNVTNEVVVYEDDVEVSSCIKEFVVEEASDEGSTPTPTSTPIMGNTCGRADSDEDGDFDISDFVEFAAAYRDGNRSCDDTTADYGVCGGRDVDRDGKLDIADFGGTNGFASRYYPKTSCALY
jgi:hypothetical protein